MADDALRLIIVGGGLAGCLIALAVKRERPEVSLLLVEQGDTFGGNHVWSYFDTDIAPHHRAFAAMLGARRWSDHEVRFPKRSRTIGIGYNSVRSEQLDRLVKAALEPGEYRLGQTVRDVHADYVVLDNGERFDGDAVIDARGAEPMPGLALAWQKFVGRTYRSDSRHGCERPVIMDATVPQTDGYRFAYWLPFSERELMVEDTYYSTSPTLDRVAVGERLDDLIAGPRGAAGAVPIAEEAGVLPVLLGGNFATLWPEGGAAIARVGLRGGFFHPTTGYSLPDAIRNAAIVAALPVLNGQAIHDLLRARAERLWKERRFFQLLNRMMFHAAEPAKRYRVLEHFYRLPESVIGRFYAARLTGLDKLRILSGRPPVPIGRAVGAMWKRAA